MPPATSGRPPDVSAFADGETPTARSGWMAACRPRCPRATRPRPTGRCPSRALAELGSRPFGFYVHVPFCTVRCGYCDFNTYTAAELGDQPGASRATYAEAAIAEIRLARRVLGDRDLPVDTVFFGGGTPTLLGAGDLAVDPGRDRRRVRARARRRGDHRGQPRQRRRLGPRGAARGGLHPDELRHAVRGRPRAPHPRPHPRPAAGPGGRRVVARGRLRRRSASTSSTARRGSRWPTGPPRSRPRSACAPDHSRRTP